VTADVAIGKACDECGQVVLLVGFGPEGDYCEACWLADSRVLLFKANGYAMGCRQCLVGR
jgi:hypothetical protein